MQMLVDKMELDEPEPVAQTLRWRDLFSWTITLPPATGPHGYAHPASIYPATVARGPEPRGDWVGTDEDGYTSAQLKARIMPVGDGKWWAQMGDEWVGDYDGITEYPTARMAREQVEMKRKEQQDA
jgi:hypothetical protein